ncbi:terminase large subunit [Dorea acetigenes]|jgi:phage terminase large subunit-like protein|uniref:Terminase large subunit n=1 Tax=Dorea acetigenes TaxID=2981787 RepID=A0ABT2RMX7_9FIRM|nr:terminase TerL endonuclease subunit [Dorea acetigenes]MCU6686772.1 terminase large subunit [Dorea acetigenes]SCJ11725.1 Phage terminase-like protein%2C large subunit [uncultured Clostridium sp.]
MAETRPKDYPKLKDYQPTRFMLPTSHYDKAKADRAVKFIENLRHTKAKWAGKRFWLLPWQETLVRDIFGTVKEDGTRQFRTAYVEICKKVGKSELAAAIALYLLYADNEPSAEVYGAAADRQQASIVFDVAKRMVELTPALLKRSKIMGATKRIVNYSNAGIYQVLSADDGNKHGFSVSGLVFDEIHNQPNRNLYDVLTKGSSDARANPLHFIITTAGNDRNSIAFELHTKALDILNGRREDPTFYPVVYGLADDEDWTDEKNWYKVNPSLGYTVEIDRLRDAFREAQQNPADEVTFRWLRLNQWVSSTVAWIPDQIYALGNEAIDMESLKGRECYGGLDLSSSGDITAFVLVFPPHNGKEKYVILPFFWVPQDTIPLRVRRTSVPYDKWQAQGYLMATEGNVIHYGFIETFIDDLGKIYNIKEIAYDRWGAVEMTQALEGMGFTVVPFGQGFSSMSPPTKRFYELLMEGKMVHGAHPVLRWMAGNVVVDTDPAGNIKVTKRRSPDKVDGIVAAIMALDRCIRHEENTGSVYDDPDRGLFVF